MPALFFYTHIQILQNMPDIKREAKNQEERNDESDSTLKDNAPILDGKKLHDLYRHTTKLIE